MEQTLGKRIAQHRKRLGLTQDALAEKLGLTAQAVSKWENDLSCPDITMLPRLAEIFGISTDELLGMEAKGVVHEAEVVNNEKTERDGVHVQKGNWEFHWDSGRKSALLWAIYVLIVGVLYLLAKWLSWDVSFWDILWPTFLLAHGVRCLFPRFRVFYFGLALFGGYSLIHNLGLWQLDIAGELVFPICIVLFGVGLLLDALRKPKQPRFQVTHNGVNGQKAACECQTENGRFECDLSFGENTYLVKVPVLKGGEADVSFGELTIDLSGCEAVEDGCQIEADCAFGQLQLLVPQRFEVQAKNSTAFASVDVIGQPDAVPQGIILLETDASFGQIRIHYV